MFSQFTVFLIFVICCTIQPALTQKPPFRFPKDMYEWGQRLMINRLINMTAEILHDTTQKMKHATKIRDKHKTSITYELGTLAAGVQERFKKMLKIYRTYGNKKIFLKNTYTSHQYLQAYHVIQGEYNEIRLEKSLFYEVKKRHASTVSTFNFRQAAVSLATPSAKKSSKNMKGQNRRKWSPRNEEYFYNLPALNNIKT